MEKTNYQMIMALGNYVPAEKGFTSKAESEFVTKTLHLNEMNAIELQNMRDMVVMIYEGRQDSNPEKRWELSESMMSVTAVIDLAKAKLGAEI